MYKEHMFLEVRLSKYQMTPDSLLQKAFNEGWEVITCSTLRADPKLDYETNYINVYTLGRKGTSKVLYSKDGPDA